MLNHINNGRYLRAMDFGRVDHCIRSGILRTIYETKSKLLVAATTIRYRKPIYLFVPYKLQSQVSNILDLTRKRKQGKWLTETLLLKVEL